MFWLWEMGVFLPAEHNSAYLCPCNRSRLTAFFFSPHAQCEGGGEHITGFCLLAWLSVIGWRRGKGLLWLALYRDLWSAESKGLSNYRAHHRGGTQACSWGEVNGRPLGKVNPHCRSVYLYLFIPTQWLAFVSVHLFLLHIPCFSLALPFFCFGKFKFMPSMCMYVIVMASG